jgi:hypothetical protein
MILPTWLWEDMQIIYVILAGSVIREGAGKIVTILLREFKEI